jgi:hypothetical protein
MNKIENQRFETERSLYNQKNLAVVNCRFEGPADGESPLKEGETLWVKDSYFDLRYPFWHDNDLLVENTTFTEKSRAAFWYDKGVTVKNSHLHGIKAFRECGGVSLLDTDVVSPEFMWKCADVRLMNVSVESEYPFFMDERISFSNLTLSGKYSFQYAKGGIIENSHLKTKDAFWHSENLTVRDSVIDGEYLGWYSTNLHLINCLIRGTQPLCYCKGLVLANCRMERCDLAFEYSEVEADVVGEIASVKNPLSGRIVADRIGETILKDSKYPSNAIIEIRRQ